MPQSTFKHTEQFSASVSLLGFAAGPGSIATQMKLKYPTLKNEIVFRPTNVLDGCKNIPFWTKNYFKMDMQFQVSKFFPLTKTKKGPTTAFFLSIKKQQQLPILINWFQGTKILIVALLAN